MDEKLKNIETTFAHMSGMEEMINNEIVITCNVKAILEHSYALLASLAAQV